MAKDSAIRISELSKRYMIQPHGARGNPTLRDALSAAARAAINPRAAWTKRRIREEFWALQDVSAEIAKGEKVGIVGGNGAGKSTLLKVLSRITPPTSGRVEIAGRVTSLLEVGTGFHPELTGRENIFLNGSILGMPHGEVRRRMEEIVDFSGVEQFLEVPVKRYSSGMKTRLGFAIAAHLDSDVLVVDEVLAVGDAEFQKRCIGKMDEVSRSGDRTILFVSHDLASVQGLCDTALLMEKGRLADQGPVDRIVSRYLSEIKSASNLETIRLPIVSVALSGGQKRAFKPDEDITVAFEVECANRVEAGVVFTVFDERNRPVISHDGSSGPKVTLRDGRSTVTLRIGASHLVHGDYFMRFRLCGKSADDRLVSVSDVPAFSVAPNGSHTGKTWGIVAPPVAVAACNGGTVQ